MPMNSNLRSQRWLASVLAGVVLMSSLLFVTNGLRIAELAIKKQLPVGSRSEAAQATLRASGKDAGRLNDYTWHGSRHTFASRLVMAGVDLRAVQELGGWKTLSMVQRNAHLAPERLAAAVERIVTVSVATPTAEAPVSTLLRENFDEAASRTNEPRAGVS